MAFKGLCLAAARVLEVDLGKAKLPPSNAPNSAILRDSNEDYSGTPKAKRTTKKESRLRKLQ
jgi:hypothetical protein